MQEKTVTVNSEIFQISFNENWIKVYRPSPVSQIIQIETVANTESSLNTTYFILPTPNKTYCVFFNVNSTGYGPNASQNFSQLEVNLDSVNTSANDVALAIKNKLDELSTEFETDITDNLLTVTNKEAGRTPTPPMDANTDFDVVTIQKGQDSDHLVKEGFPHSNRFYSGTNLYEITDVSLTGAFDGDDFVGLNVTVDGIYKTFEKNINQYNKPVWTSQFEDDTTTYPNWITF